MKFRIDGLGLFGGGHFDSLEEARDNLYDKKGRKGNIIVEMEELEYISLINGYEEELAKNTAANNNLLKENQRLKKQVAMLISPEALEMFKSQAQRLINAEKEAREKLNEELTSQIKLLIRREEGLRNALAKWKKKVTGKDLRPPNDIKQKGIYYKKGRRGLIKTYTQDKYLPFPPETDIDEIEEYARTGLKDGVLFKKLYLSRGNWVASYESSNPL